jgi:predicted RNase H-like HicB family nuclease
MTSLDGGSLRPKKRKGNEGAGCDATETATIEATTTAPASPLEVRMTAKKTAPEMRKHYIALVHKDDETGFGVSFPDFPGAATTAPTLDEAVERAGKALASHVESMVEDGAPIPPPSGFVEIIKDYPDAMPLLVPMPLIKTQS